MAQKSIKQRLREAEKQNHEAFRRQLVEDVAGQLDRWTGQVEQLLQRRSRENAQALENMKQVRGEVDEVCRQLRRLNAATTAEINRLRRGRTWKFYLNSVLAAVLASLTTIGVCAAYWPELQRLFR